ncbi:Protein kinase-like domain [Cordyceps militaris CM01]|uniref:Protein kinase-like domain n=1 Tax=Cordyceps militaris (strain CM01) TaxID=983644 RepID=G3JEN5_CORMM|nr:Protein kinase-like domain [Cordyceps militaris CM01]EGX93432.1 Protein kinase-like domain [Cordyceps militaris CM01]
MPPRDKPDHRLGPAISGHLRPSPSAGISHRFTWRRPRLAWAARPVSTMKARDRQNQVWSAPATAPNSGGPDDGPVHDMHQDLERAHRERLPGARIMIARPRSVQHIDPDHAWLQPAEFISQSSDGSSILGVLQRLEDVCFNFHVPFLSMPSAPGSKIYELRAVLSYNPASDECEFFCNSHDVCLVGESANQSHLLKQGQIQDIEPGMWTIVVPSIPTPGGNGLGRWWPVVKFLLLKRTFASTVTRPTASESDGTATSSTTDDYMVNMALRTKRSAETVAEFVMGTVESSESDKTLPNISKNEILEPDTGPFYQLRDEETLQVTTKPAGGDDAKIEQRYARTAESYRVKRLERIDRNTRSSVFVCTHSKLPHTTLVAKALNVGPSIRSSIASLANHWANEMEILRTLDHKNIVKIFMWDARVYTVYLEHLPDSLASYPKGYFTSKDAERILLDVASALAYLEEEKICHNDIKPRNIAYSPERGAVVLDFGLATRGRWVPPNAGGTAWYLPPEIVENGPRSSPSSVWALGITMLYVLGKIGAPEEFGRAWAFHNMQDPNGPDRRAMEGWLDYILFDVVAELDMGDPMQHVISCMMEQQPNDRPSAHQIEPLLKGEQERTARLSV